MQKNYSKEEVSRFDSKEASWLSKEMREMILEAARYEEVTPTKDQLCEALKLGFGKKLFPTEEEEHAWIHVRPAGDCSECFSNVHKFIDEIEKAMQRKMKDTEKEKEKKGKTGSPFKAVFGLKVYFAYDTENKLSGIKAVAHVVAYHVEKKAYYDPSPEDGEEQILFVPHNEMFTEDEKTKMLEAYKEGQRFEMGFLLIDMSEKKAYQKHVKKMERITGSDVLAIHHVTDDMPLRFYEKVVDE